MATIKFTPQQSRAIDHSGSALLVSAAAGSGKTAVLVERAVRILCREEDPVDAARLLIVTCGQSWPSAFRPSWQNAPARATCAASGCSCSARPSAPSILTVCSF